MHAVTICLILIALACAASLIGRFVRVPLPFVQIAIGVVAALPPLGMRVTLEPQAFLLLFIPPLLFADGWTLPRRALLSLRWPVLGHAVGLVLLTVLVGGYGLHWLIPSMPLPVAFAVAALVSPTDAVAVSAITERIRVPMRMMHLLESEALLNDASGLVAMRFAVAATLSGGFSLAQAAGSFVLVAIGGLAIGCLLTLGYAQLHRLLLVRARDATLQTVLSGLLPFAAYALAEAVGASGILAAVAAGMTAGRVRLLEGAHYSARMQTGSSWQMISFCLNGIIFVLLGLQLPDIVGSGPDGIDLLSRQPALALSRGQILGDIAALTALLVALRFVWVLGSMLLGRLLGLRDEVEGVRLIAASSLAGVRGAVTLAGVLSLPLLMPDGSRFPARDLAVTLATGVILCSMLIAAVALPVLLRQRPGEREDGQQDMQRELQQARIVAMEAALRALCAIGARPGSRESNLIAIYRSRLTVLRNAGMADAAHARTDEDAAWRDLHRTALHAERAALQALQDEDRLDDAGARTLLGELDVVEAALMHRPVGLEAAEG